MASVARAAAVPYVVEGVVSAAIGRIVSAFDVEEAMRRTVQAWQDAYLAAVARQQGRDPYSLPSIRSWNVSAEFSDFPESQLPSAIIVAPGTAGTTRRATGYEAVWAVGVAVVVSAATERDTDQIAKLYAAAIRAAVVQHGSLGGLAESTEWESERFDDVLLDPPDAERTLVAAQVRFNVTVAGAVDPALGLLEVPPGDPRAPILPDTVTTAEAAIVPVRPPSAIP